MTEGQHIYGLPLLLGHTHRSNCDHTFVTLPSSASYRRSTKKSVTDLLIDTTKDAAVDTSNSTRGINPFKLLIIFLI